MLAPREFPEWLPPAVREEARRILNSEGADEALILRLATDERMKGVWGELAKHKKDKLCQPSDWALLMRDRVDIPPPDSSDPLALFFWCAYTIAWVRPIVGTLSNRDLPIAQYRAEAARLRLSAAMLRKLNLQHGPQIDVQDQFIEIHARQIEDAAEFCDEIVSVYAKFKDAEAPLVVERDFGSNETRGYVRMLAVETRNLFGQLLAGTLAKVASVATGKEVTPAQVHNWARPAPR
jgi:hypothetical protein